MIGRSYSKLIPVVETLFPRAWMICPEVLGAVVVVVPAAFAAVGAVDAGGGARTRACWDRAAAARGGTGL